MWAAMWLLVFGVALVAGTVRDPGRFWWTMLGFLLLFFVPPLIIEAARRTGSHGCWCGDVRAPIRRTGLRWCPARLRSRSWTG